MHVTQMFSCLYPILCRSFEEMEAQITAGMKTPVLSSRPGPEGSAGDKSRKRESESLSQTLSTEREEQVSQTSSQKFRNNEQLSYMPYLCHIIII